MVKFKKKDTDNDDEEKEVESKYRARKVPLKSILKECAENENHPMLMSLYERSKTITEISSLASLLLLFNINEALDKGDKAYFEDKGVMHKGKTYFKKGEQIIKQCFNAVLIQNANNDHMMPTKFFNWVITCCDKEQFQWPKRDTEFYNAFTYFYQMYTTNTQTNLKTHCEQRLRYFLKIKCWKFNERTRIQIENTNQHYEFDGLDERNAIKYVMKAQDWTNEDIQRTIKMNILVNEIKRIGWPGTMKMKQFLHKQWFESIWLFGQIQREVEQFTQNVTGQWKKFKGWNTTVKKPPKVKRFAVIPLCDYHLKHFRLDTRDLFNTMKTNKWLPSEQNERHYREHKEELWGEVFDLDKIKEIIGPKNTFHFQIVTDSVSASVVFKPPKAQPKTKTVAEDQANPAIYNGKRYEIGIDPNMKLYLGVVRHDLLTGVEVNIKMF